MKINIITLLILPVFLYGCASTANPGTKRWYDAQMQEIEAAYAEGELTKAEYLQLKVSAAQARSSLVGGALSGSPSHVYVTPTQ